uniref:Uncharacterized protein n=1 Tax=Arion vulgaris TaxID=1028688 RepID=A0A0B6Z814_9EUPU
MISSNGKNTTRGRPDYWTNVTNTEKQASNDGHQENNVQHTFFLTNFVLSDLDTDEK